MGIARSEDVNAVVARIAQEAKSIKSAKVNVADSAKVNTPGWASAVIIPNGGTVPVGTPANTIVIELEA